MAAHLGPFPVEFGTVFPDGAYAAGGVEKVRDFDKSSGDRVVQQADKATGLPLWVIEVIDPQEGTRQRTVKTSDAVKLSSCPGDFLAGSGEGGGLVVVLAGGQAPVQAAEHAAEQVALGGGVPAAVLAAAVVMGAGAG